MDDERFVRDSFLAVIESEEYRVQVVISEITEAIIERMEALRLSRSQVANRLGVSPAMVTKLLRGQNNSTVRTLVQLADALDCRVSVTFQPVSLSDSQYSEADEHACAASLAIAEEGVDRDKSTP
ncbi:MAG: helix-turn-helix domain-containing protein [Coriobacteriia bacterium]